MSKIQIKKTTGIIIGLTLLSSVVLGQLITNQDQPKGEINVEAQLETLTQEVEDLDKEKKLNAIEIEEVNANIKLKKLQIEKLELKNGIKEEVKEKSPKAQAPVAKTKSVTGVKDSKYWTKWFGKKTGEMHFRACDSQEVGRKFMNAFNTPDEKLIACATLNHENGIVGGNYITDAVSPCWSTNAKLAQMRKCTYASDNSKGVDAGLFMINTYYQAKTITKLGGPACNFVDSRDPKDACNVKKIAWLHNVDNQIKIIKHIYDSQGFEPWVAYKKHVKPYR